MKKEYGVKFLSFSSSLPKKVVKNTDLEKLFETSDDWIYTRTGIRERRIIGENESGLSLSVDAAKQVLNDSKTDPKDVDLIIVSTTTPDKLYPSMSCMLQGEIGATNAVSFDISAACSGFVFGIITAAQFIYTGTYKNILIVGVDIHSRFIDWSERSVAVLFGDGAGATLLTSCPTNEDQLLGSSMHSESDIKRDLELNNINIIFPDTKKTDNPNFVKMNGKSIFQFAVRVIPDVINKLLKKIKLKQEQIDYLIMHQANQRIIDFAATKLGFKNDQIISNIEKVGNTSAASIPIALVDGISKGKIKQPSKLLFGAGLTWGAVAIDWK